MKYKDKYLTITAPKIFFFDTDRPFPALLECFNPDNNELSAGSRSILYKCFSIVSNLREPVTVTVCDKALHAAIPSLMYLRKMENDKYVTVSTNLVIKDHSLAEELLKNNLPHFTKTSREAVDYAFKRDTFQYFIFNVDDKGSVQTAIELMDNRKGIISIHNPEYKDTTWFLKYVIDKGLMGLENVDGSADFFHL